MKKQASKNGITILSKHLSIVLLAIVTFLNPFAFYSEAQELTKVIPEVKIKYTETKNGLPIFHVNFENQEKETLELILKDEKGYTLYTETITESVYSKRFQIDLANDVKLHLVVKGGKGKQSQSYLINSSVKTVSDFLVTKL
jgi:hypothetical protein